MMESDRERVFTAVEKILKAGIYKIVITHGTDSMEQTAKFLNARLGKKLTASKTSVILTGSNEHTGAAQTDAWGNLSLAINENKLSRRGGVFIAFNNTFVPGRYAEKEFFDGNSMKYINCKSSKFKNSAKREAEEVDKYKKALIKKLGKKQNNLKIIEYAVNTYRRNHEVLKKMVLFKKPDVIFFKLYHSGTANTLDENASVSKLVEKLTAKGVVCFGGSENGEPTDLHSYETSVALLNAGMVPLYNMLLPVGVLKAKLINIDSNSALTKRAEIINKMLVNIAGEIDEKLVNSRDVIALQNIT
jgi:L-asparaginase/Glu-tRNA(Gln) amidotransferase subunit D